MIHSKPRSLSIVSTLSKLGLCISKERHIQLSVGLGNTVVEMNEKEGIVLPTNLRRGLFSTASIDNIDIHPKSSTARTSLHGTATSINQHLASDNVGQFRNIPDSLSTYA